MSESEGDGRPADWRTRAACRDGQLTRAFFNEAWDVARQKTLPGFEAARAVCLVCPVRPECLEFALSLKPGEIEGVFAGAHPGLMKRLAGSPRMLHCRECGEPLEAMAVIDAPARRWHCEQCKKVLDNRDTVV